MRHLRQESRDHILRKALGKPGQEQGRQEKSRLPKLPARTEYGRD